MRVLRILVAPLVAACMTTTGTAAQTAYFEDALVVERLKDYLLGTTFAAHCDDYDVDQDFYSADWSDLMAFLAEIGYPRDRVTFFMNGEGRGQVVNTANSDLRHYDTSLTDSDAQRFCAAGENALGDSAWSMRGLLKRTD